MTTHDAPRRGLVFALIVAVQLLDVAVHVAVGQVEPIRILSNALLVGGVAFGAKRPAGLWLGACVYLVLNALFLWDQGLVNPTTGSLRAPLFGFVATSLSLTAWFSRLPPDSG